LIYRATSIFDLHMRIFNLQGLGAPDKPKKKKIEYAEIDFTSYHSFLRVRRDQFRQNCKKTHPIVQVIDQEKVFFHTQQERFIIGFIRTKNY
jgi:hypothetical protein